MPARQEWSTIRTFAATAADSSGFPGSSVYVPLLGTPERGIPHVIEFTLSGCSVGGAPTSAIVDLYRYQDGVEDFLYSWVISATDITSAKVTPVLVEMHGSMIYGKVSFSGGTSPTLTGTLRARAVE